MEHKEQTNQLLREHDREWEQTKARELGAEAKMGPSSSPVKRSNNHEMEEGAPRKKRKKWRHRVWEEGQWGEHIEGKGAAAVSAGEQTTVEPHTPTREPAVPGRSRIPGEDSLRQLRLTGFWNPASHGRDRHSMDNGAASSMGSESATTKLSSGGSPCEARGEDRPMGTEEDNPFGGGINLENIEGDGHQLEKGEITSETEHTSMEARGGTGCMKEYNVMTEMPSSGENENELLRKPHVEEGVEKVCSDDITENECVFKRGGWCMTHSMKGKKIVNKKKVWCMKKDGLFGYVVRTNTNYSCMLGSSMVNKPVISTAGNRSDSALGGDSTSIHLGNIDNQLSGVGNNWAGAKKSES